MKYAKIVLGVLLVGLVSTAIIINPKAQTEEFEIGENNVLNVSEEPVNLNDVSLENTSNEATVEYVVTTNEYRVERDGITYNFLFPTPENADGIVERINEVFEEEFTECYISYISEDATTGQYEVKIGLETFVIGVTL